MQGGDVIQLQPGTGAAYGGERPMHERPDYTPHAQPPDPITGIMAHTPDPTEYHDAGGRTMIPRATRHYGSLGFTTNPGVLNIDPADPVRGTGGFTVDTEKITKTSANMAARQSGGNPLAAWAIAAEAAARPDQLQMPAPEARMAPPGHPGYVVPQATPGGAQIHHQQQAQPMSPAAQALGGQGTQPAIAGTVQNPSIKKPGGPAMSMPQQVPVPSSGAQVQAAPHPAMQQPGQPPMNVQQPVQNQAPAWDQQQPQQQQPVYQQPVPQQPQQQQPMYQQPQYPPQQPMYQQPQYPPQPQIDPTQAAILQALQGITTQLGAMANGQHQAPQESPVPLEQVDWRKEKEAMVREKLRERDHRKASPAEDMPTEADLMAEQEGVELPPDTGLDFLTNPPSPPRVQVVFDLGHGGRHLKRFHHIAVSGFWLTMIYDSRYEGDQFIPPVTNEGEAPITITFPQHNNRTVRCIVPNGANQRIGCMDMINFCIMDDAQSQQTTAPMMDMFGQAGAEMQDLGAAIEGLSP